jgi:hypothetical protein
MNVTAGSHWTLEEGEIELEGDIHTVDVRVPNGSVTVAVTDGPPRVSVEAVIGPPVLVIEDGGGALTVRQPAPEGPEILEDLVGSVIGALAGPRGPRSAVRRSATVTVLLPRLRRATVRGVGTSVMLSGVDAGSVDVVSGDVTVSRTGSSLSVRTVSGQLQAADVVGRVNVTTVSGDVTMARGRFTELRAHTVSGDFVIDAALGAGEHAFRSVSGNLALRTDAPAGLDLEAVAISGSVTCKMAPATSEGGPGYRRTRVRTGGAGAHLRVNTVSGDVTVMPGAGS